MNLNTTSLPWQAKPTDCLCRDACKIFALSQSTSGRVTSTTDPTYEKTSVGRVSAFEHTSLISVLGTFSNSFLIGAWSSYRGTDINFRIVWDRYILSIVTRTRLWYCLLSYQQVGGSLLPMLILGTCLPAGIPEQLCEET